MLDNIAQQGYNFQKLRRSTYTPQTVAFSSNKETTSYYEALNEDDYKLQDLLFDPIGFSAAAEKDSMYYNLHPYLILMHASKMKQQPLHHTNQTTDLQTRAYYATVALLQPFPVPILP